MRQRSDERATIETVQYYFTKIGPGNALAAPLLEDRRMGTQAIAGFFRGVRLPEIRDHVGDQRPRFSYQALDLYRWATGELQGYAINLAQGIFRVLAPAGEMYEVERDLFEKSVGPTPHTDDVPKLVPVHEVYRERMTHIPTLLTQINANRRLSSSTFKVITDDFGNNFAIDYLLFKGGLLEGYPRSTPETRTIQHLLLCLGANELISLVARILEEQGLYVPAPNGGFVKNVDLFAYNDSPRTLDIAGLRVPGRSAFRSGAITLQVKGISTDTRPEVSPEVDYLVQLNAELPDRDTPTEDVPSAGRVFNAEWIETMLRRSPNTRRYLNRLLRWVPFAGSVIRALETRELEDRSAADHNPPPGR